MPKDRSSTRIQMKNRAAIREAALEVFETERKPRTARIQENSLANEFMKGPGNADWVYGYNAWGVALSA